MDTWNCCRTCLSVESLHPIFQYENHHEKYSEVIFSATGLKVEYNDTLPQQMCTTCINFINTSYKFRKKCEEAYQSLLSRLNDNPICSVKLETDIFPPDNDSKISIDITHLVNDFNNHDNGINDFTLYDDIEKQEEDLIYDSKDQELNDKDIENNCKRKTRSKKSDKPVKRTLRRKKEDGDKKTGVKEEIECEYCHKILTSKLSLRNHYKIHTGFDVVCEHCGKKFITRRLLLMHCRAKHGYEKTDKCSFCDYRASNAEQVKIHERLHTGEKPFVCAECGAGFHRKSSYLQHVAIHLPDKNVQVRSTLTLTRVYYTHRKSSYLQHVAIHLPDKNVQVRSTLTLTRVYYTHRKSSYLQHVAIHLPDKNVQVRSTLTLTRVYYTHRKSSYLQHVAIHLPDKNVQVRSTLTLTRVYYTHRKSSYLQHVAIHLPDKNVQVRSTLTLTRVYYTHRKSSYLQHVAIHLPDKNVQVRSTLTLTRVYYTHRKSSYLQHVAIHLPDKNVQVRSTLTLTRVYYTHRKSSYLQHVAIHLPDKNVQCDQCPARFKSVTLMRIHKNRHKAPQYSFKCRICQNTFVRRRNAVRHLLRIHAVQAGPQHIDRLKIA
ncbi:zinc finger protein ZFP2 isoform X4 [Spodoptera frugiperda]|uniref:Zinc finger protein ZFP2 isoform X4 n=1 Tax=Spodoptera frugiperda TaxID=7108 RepID=A0A9R0E6T6_SPOFR|nr:zinc finger protein ZFP2 isoform X4 [Spodoptera frugiperda]